MKVKVWDKDVLVSKKFIHSTIDQLFEESYYMWKSKWYTKEEKESHFSKKIMAVETIVQRALQKYLRGEE